MPSIPENGGIFTGLDALFEYAHELARALPVKNSIAIILHHHLAELIMSCEYALNHYLGLTLEEDYLQRSLSFESPYKKWAQFTNEDFKRVDQSVRSIVPVIWQLYQQRHPAHDDEPIEVRIYRSEASLPHPSKAMWFLLLKLHQEYACCTVDTQNAELSYCQFSLLSSLADADPTVHMLCEDSKYKMMEMTRTAVNIKNRATVAELKHRGAERLRKLKAMHDVFGAWLTEAYTMDDAVRHHGEQLQLGLFQ